MWNPWTIDPCIESGARVTESGARIDVLSPGVVTPGLEVCRTLSAGFRRRAIRAALALPRRLHRSQQGSISILSVFAVLALVMLLGMVINVGRHVDGKIRMQNAADDAAYSGGVMIARELNTLAFTNHLMCEVFALTAIMREARDRNSDRYVPQILAAWVKAGELFQGCKIPKFQVLGEAIIQKVPLEQELARAFGEWMAAASQRVLPVFEEILGQEMIPHFQQAVRQVYPELARLAADEVAQREGQPDWGRGAMVGSLWRADSGQAIGGGNPEWYELIIDPVYDDNPNRAIYFSDAQRWRNGRADDLRGIWNGYLLAFFDNRARMSQYANLWRSFTCAQLNKLMAEYPDRNLPFVLNSRDRDLMADNAYLDHYFSFVGVVSWGRLPELGPGIFRNPSGGAPLAFAQARVFVPKPRLRWGVQGGPGRASEPLGGIPGASIELPPEYDPLPGPDSPPVDFVVVREHRSAEWSLYNQNWTAQLVVATAPTLGNLLAPDLGGLGVEDLRRISTH